MTGDERALDQCPSFVPLSTCYLYRDCDAMRRRSTTRLILSIHVVSVGSAAALGQSVQSVDIAAERRRRVEIGDRPGIAESNAELARLPQRAVPA